MSDVLQTVALGFSKFCDLFTEEEWEGYEYFVGMFSGTILLMGLTVISYLQILVSRLSSNHVARGTHFFQPRFLVQRRTR
jgi:hypothetical protein